MLCFIFINSFSFSLFLNIFLLIFMSVLVVLVHKVNLNEMRNAGLATS